MDIHALYSAISNTLARDGFHHAEICHYGISLVSLGATRFRTAIGKTYLTSIGSCPEEIIAGFSKSARKAVRSNLGGELRAVTTEDPVFVDHYYDQLREVFAKDGIKLTYSKERVWALWNLLMPTGRRLATMVMKGNVCVATRIDLCGEDRLHSFGSASYGAFLKFHPNEFARYHAMCKGMKRGLTTYDMTGGGSYKAKFGGEPVDIQRLIYSSPVLIIAREFVRKWHRWRIQLKRII